MKCKKCGGLVVSKTMYDESFKHIKTLECLNCCFVQYPDFIPLGIKVNNPKQSRKGIPTMFTYKKGVTNGK